MSVPRRLWVALLLAFTGLLGYSTQKDSRVEGQPQPLSGSRASGPKREQGGYGLTRGRVSEAFAQLERDGLALPM